MMMICDEQSCTGCLVCKEICSQKAITVQLNDQGFCYPEIDENKCINCGRCKAICPVNLQKKNPKTVVPLAAWSLDKIERIAATSGGVFIKLARSVVKQDGIVYGAAFANNMQVVHSRVAEGEKVETLRGSKYVQSDTNDIYHLVKGDLQANKTVLFSGTPCQVSALKNYLGREYNNLFLVDIMCHGVPSPRFYHNYKKWLENKFGGNIISFNFRYKKPGWSVYSVKAEFDNQKVYISSKFEDPYLGLFSADFLLRRSCFKCKYACAERVGDITLADFWQYRATNKMNKGSEKGVNLVLVNTVKGWQLLDIIKSELVVEEHTWNEANKSNLQLSEPNQKPEKYEEFWQDLNDKGFEETIQQYWKANKKIKWKTLLIVWKRAHEYLLPHKKI